MIDLRVYDDTLFRVHEVVSSKLDSLINLSSDYFYRQNNNNINSLISMFDIKQIKNSKQAELLLQEPLTIYYKEGTKKSLETALKSFFGGADLKEWFEYDKEPYFFKVEVEVSDEGIDEKTFECLDEVIKEYKNVRSVCSDFQIILKSELTEYIGNYSLGAEVIEIYPYESTSAKANQEFVAGVVTFSSEIIELPILNSSNWGKLKMENEYYGILTTTGKNKLIKASTQNLPVNLKYMVFGSSQDKLDEGSTKLQDEKYKVQINALYEDELQSNVLIAEGVIPAKIGGFMIHQVGIYSDDDLLFCVSQIPAIIKPKLSGGASKELIVRQYIAVENIKDIKIDLNDSISLATKKYVDDEIKKINRSLQVNKNITTTQDCNLERKLEEDSYKAYKNEFIEFLNFIENRNDQKLKDEFKEAFKKILNKKEDENA